MSDIIQKIHDYTLEDIMGESFGRYSKYIIQERAIPDVRDGLKPVQRRILYSMYKKHYTFDKQTVKCAKIVGDVIGSYHPHGDSSVYDAMVRMSQNWKQRHQLIAFQGNNGSIDGDPAAAYRYTEAKLAKLSNEILKDIDMDTVDMALNFDDSIYEPTVLPSRFPNLLLNGSTGISAGYATNIPPHNLEEIIEATIKRIDSPSCRLDTIMEIIKGPDFPTGGTIYGIDGIRSAFENGKGKVIIRSKYQIKKEKGKTQIVITEIPFEVNKTTLVSKITEIKIDKKIEGISDVRDETDSSGMQIVIDLKTGANTDLIVNYLLKNTDLQTTYNYNIVAIVNKRPKQLGILPILDAYIAHQKDVVIRRTKYDLAAKEKEFHILEGLIKALSILDEVIKTIRASKNKSDAINNLEKEYEFTYEQAKAIVELQLYKLTNTDIEEITKKIEELKRQIELLKTILNSEEVLLKVIKHELKIIKKEYGDPRRSIISDLDAEIKIDIKETIAKENVIVVVTNEGYIKKVPTKSYLAAATEETTLKPGDFVTGLYEVTTLDTLLVFTNLGNYLFVPIHNIFEAKWKELGKHISNLIPISAEEKVVASIILNDENKNLVLFTKNGMIKKTLAKEFIVTRYSKPLTAIKLKEDDELVNVTPDEEEYLFITNNGYYLRFNSNEINSIGVKAAGVKGINLKDDYVINAFSLLKTSEYLNLITNNKTGKRVKLNTLVPISRAKKGNQIIKKVKSFDYKIINAYQSEARDLVGIKCDSEITIVKNSDIPIMDNYSTGSSLSKYGINDSFIVTELISYLKKKQVNEKVETPEQKEEPQELTISDFIEDFKL